MFIFFTIFLKNLNIEANMILSFFKKYYYFLILILVIALITIFKLPYFNLPFYWDEAWSYAMAIFEMAEKGPTLIPGHANDWFTRGHPLLYYFLASIWLKVFGTNVLSAHIFSFIISIFAIFTSFYVFKSLIGNINISLLIVLAIVVQAIFLAQCTMLLPEIFLMTLGMWTLYFYYRNKLLWYLIFGSLLVLVKETGLVFILFIMFDRIFFRKIIYIDGSESNRRFLHDIVLLIIPLLIFLLFITIQKINSGYFLFPEHTNMVVKDFKTIYNNFKSFTYQLLFYQGRNLWTIIFILLVPITIVKKYFKQDELYIILSVFLFIIVYMLFCSVNFFTTRYLLAVLPWYFYVVITSICKSFGKRMNWSYVLIIFLIILNLLKSLRLEGEGDVVLTYKNSVKLHKEVVNYLEKEKWYDKKVYTGFLMRFNLMYPHLGYLSGNKIFNNIVDAKDAEILIFYSNEPDMLYDRFKSDSTYVSVKRFENKGAWVEIIKKKENQ